MAFIAMKPEGTYSRAECNKCHASRVARVITFISQGHITTIVTEFVNKAKRSCCSPRSCHFRSACLYLLSLKVEAAASWSDLAAALANILWVWFQLTARCGCGSDDRRHDMSRKNQLRL